MKFKGLFIVTLFCINYQAHSQYYSDIEKALSFEVGVSVGPMNAFTDLGGRRGRGQTGVKDFNINNTKLYGSLYVTTTYKNIFSVRLEYTQGGVKANDSLLDRVKGSAIGRYSRNLSFRSVISEITLTAEVHPLVVLGNTDPDASISPYVIAGLGYFHFNPQAQLNSAWIDLRPLRTEGEGFPEFPERKVYKLNQINIPMGVGIRYQLSNSFNFRLEYLTRKLNTDYLDDVSTTYIDPNLFDHLSGTDRANALLLNNRLRPGTPPNETTARPGGKRGDPKDNDHYFTVNFKIGYIFGSEDGSFNSRPRKNKQYYCPGRF
jgi:Domain of unknown function (DUF6089)